MIRVHDVARQIGRRIRSFQQRCSITSLAPALQVFSRGANVLTLCLVFLLAPSPVFAAEEVPKPVEISKFAILTSVAKTPPVLGLNGDLRIRVNGDVPIVPTTLQLRMDGTVLGVAPRLMPGREIVFRLERQPAVEANRAMWVRLLGDPIGRGRDRSAPISLELNERPLPYGTVDSAKSDEALEAKITLSAYHIGLMWVGGLAALAAAIAVIFCLRIHDGHARQRRAANASPG